MEVIFWIIIIIFFILALLGILIPMLPDILLLWAGILTAKFALGTILPPFFWWVLIFATIFFLSSDFITNTYFIKKHGGSKWAVLSVLTGIILGLLFLGPAGVIIGPVIAVFLVGILEGKSGKTAIKGVQVVIFSLLSSVILKIVLMVLLIIWFFILI